MLRLLSLFWVTLASLPLAGASPPLAQPLPSSFHLRPCLRALCCPGRLGSCRFLFLFLCAFASSFLFGMNVRCFPRIRTERVRIWHWPVRGMAGSVFAACLPGLKLQLKLPLFWCPFWPLCCFPSAISYFLHLEAVLPSPRAPPPRMCIFKSQSNNNKNISQQTQKVIGGIVCGIQCIRFKANH